MLLTGIAGPPKYQRGAIHVNDYMRLRKAQQSLNRKLLDSLPNGPKRRKVVQNAAKELGYRVKDGVIAFDSELAMDRLYDFLIYETGPDGHSLASKYLSIGFQLPREEELVLRAAVGSTASLYSAADADLARCRFRACNLIDPRQDCWITDRGMSHTIKRHTVLFTRVFEVGDICFSSGAGVCFDASETEFLFRKYKAFDNVKNEHLRSRKRYGLFMRLAKQSAIHVRYG